MVTITTKLTTSGNSKAVRLPQALLRMSKLGNTVELEARNGQIIIRNSKHPRTGWRKIIEDDIKANGPFEAPDDYGDMVAEREATVADGLGDLPWDGVSFEECQKNHAKQ